MWTRVDYRVHREFDADGSANAEIHDGLVAGIYGPTDHQRSPNLYAAGNPARMSHISAPGIRPRNLITAV
jgi:hypothetical protein